jgi:hypothetical protein
LEHSVAEFGGTYAMEDTDSMAIVATKDGGLIPCAGGPYRTKKKREAIKALSWKQVKEISTNFEALNPYDRSAVPGSVLKIEKDNFDPESGEQQQLFCFAISAKRYPLFVIQDGQPVIAKESQHGLGHLLNPIDPASENRDWISQVWLKIVSESMGLPTERLAFEEMPAIARLSVSSPALLRPLGSFNEGKPYSDQIKPFNFGLTCFVRPLGHPIGTHPERFHLIAPYESDSQRWPKLEWIDQYSGKKYRITTDDRLRTRNVVHVKTYGDILREYEFHPESKCADAKGEVCGKQTIGLLQRRHVQVARLKYIGKESNRLEEVESGRVHAAQSVYTEYADSMRWTKKILPALKQMPLKVLVKKCAGKLSRRALIDLRSGRSRPHPKNEKFLAEIVCI